MHAEWNISNEKERLALLNDLDYTVHKLQIVNRHNLRSKESIEVVNKKCKKITTHSNHSKPLLTSSLKKFRTD